MDLPEGKMGDPSVPLLCQPLVRPGVGGTADVQLLRSHTCLRVDDILAEKGKESRSGSAWVIQH